MADITSNLTTRYTYDDGATATDIISGYNGTLINSPTFVTGKIGPYAIAFNGSNQAYNVPSTFIFYSNCATAGTFAAWVKANDYSGGCISYEAGATGNNFNIEWPFASNDTLHCNLGANVDIPGVKNDFSTGVWYHLGMTWDGTNVKLYVNGALDVSYVNSSTSNLAYPGATDGTQFGRYSFGNGSATGAYFNGQIDDARIYGGRALSAADMLALYQFTGVSSTNSSFLMNFI